LANPVALSAFCFLGAAVLYWRTLAPTVLPGDAGEFQFAAWGFWLAHPTGYPLYLLLGGIAQHLLPFGDPAYRLNLFSAFWSALAVAVAFLAFWNVTRMRGAALIAAATFAVSPMVWAQATRAEVYALNTFFVALLAWLGIMWRARPHTWLACAFAFTFGLSLAHHRMTLLLIPAFAALFAQRVAPLLGTPALLFRRGLMYSLFAAMPLVLYLYIPLRMGATPYALLPIPPADPIVVYENSLQGWLAVVLGSAFQSQIGLTATSVNILLGFPATLLAELNAFGILVALLGMVALLLDRRFTTAAFILFGVLGFVWFASIYHIGDIADYFAPAFFFAGMAIAAGIAFAVGALREVPQTRDSSLPVIALLAFTALLPMQNLFAQFAARDASRRVETRAAWEELLASDIPRNAILVSNDRDEITPMYYMQLVEKLRPDLMGLFPRISPGPRFDNVVSLVTSVAPTGRPIFSIKAIPALSLRYAVEEQPNGLWRVRVDAPAPPEHPSEAILADALQVHGFTINEGEPYPGEKLIIGVQYEPLRSLKRPYTLSLQLFDLEGEKVGQADDHVPGQGEYPPTRWGVGELIQDRFSLMLNSELSPGSYSLMLRAYTPAGEDELGELTEIGTIEILE
jgi:hypothetical protein